MKKKTVRGCSPFLWILLIILMIPCMVQTKVYAAEKMVPGYTKLTKITPLNENSVKINWKKTTNATHYRIYYKEACERKWHFIKTVSGKTSSFTHKSSFNNSLYTDIKYTYTVRGYNKNHKTYGKYNKKGLSVILKNDIYNPSKAFSIRFKDPGRFLASKKTKFKFEPIIRPTRASNQKLIWKSQYPDIATVDENGNISVHKSGKTKIYATTTDGSNLTASGFLEIKLDNPEKFPEIILGLVNDERKKAGVKPLKLHAKTTEAAMIRAKELAINYSHTRPNGTNCTTVLAEVGCGGRGLEDIGHGVRTPKMIVDAWVDSHPHYIAMINAKSDTLGVGFHETDEGLRLWVIIMNYRADEIHTVNLNSMGGNPLKSLKKFYMEETESNKLPVPQREGYIFKGWHYNEACTKKIDVLKVEQDMTIYAKWIPE